MESIDLVTKYDTLLEKTIKLEQEKKDEKILSEKQLNDLNNKYNNFSLNHLIIHVGLNYMAQYKYYSHHYHHKEQHMW